MGRIWSEQRRYETWLQVEIAAAEAMAAAGIVPAEAARELRDKGAFDIARIDEIEKITQHDVIAFTTSVAEIVGPSARWLHFGLTSSDVDRHRAGAADGRSLRPDSQEHGRRSPRRSRRAPSSTSTRR